MSVLRLNPDPMDPRDVEACEHAMRVSSMYRDLILAFGEDIRIWRDEPMSRHTTLRVGGPADLFVEPDTEEMLGLVLGFSRLHKLPVMIVGRGSNLLVRDGGIRGVVVSLGQPGFAALEIDGTKLRVGAGVRLKDLAHQARRAGIAGFEFFEGIPGNLGGALRMNAGAMGSWTFERVQSVRCMNRLGEVETWAVSDIPVEYRSCPLLRDRIALGAELEGEADTMERIQERMATYSKKRWSSQPNQPSAGCAFKNPRPDLPAGKLIQELGLKGTRCGEAAISDVHGNFFVNLGGARAADVLGLIELARDHARTKAGVELELELEVTGED